MARAITLARRALGHTRTNPMVGCVIAGDNRILAEGWHTGYGAPHAERMALAAIRPEDMSSLPQATMYVTLEPCNHHGKTPPCTEAIIQCGIRHVYVGAIDPNPLVSGKGIAALRDAGIDVTLHPDSDDTHALIAPFTVQQTLHRPYIILKWAQSADRYIGRRGESVWISSPQSKRMVHHLRSEVDGIVAGKNTLLTDDPLLNTREYPGRSPVRVVVDRKGELSPSLNVFRRPGETLLFSSASGSAHIIEGSDHITQVRITTDTDLPALLQLIYAHGIGVLLVEGGATVLQSFLGAELWDEVMVITSPDSLGHGIPAPAPPQAGPAGSLKVGGDTWHFYSRHGGSVSNIVRQ